MNVTWRRIVAPVSTPFPPSIWQRIPTEEQRDLYWWLIRRATKGGPIAAEVWLLVVSLYRHQLIRTTRGDVERGSFSPPRWFYPAAMLIVALGLLGFLIYGMPRA